MTGAQTPEAVSPKLLKVMQRAKRDPEVRFTSLAHLLDEDALRRAYDRIRKDAAVGVDGVTKQEYGQCLEDNVRRLHEQLRTMRYRHQPVRRVHIPKERDKTRPIGISTVEDKMVQGALTEVLEAIYEPVFLDCSWGFRPGRGAHDALRVLHDALYQGEVNWILEADIQTFFDSIDRKMLMEMLRERIADTSLLRLIGKCLHVGILDGESFTQPDEGTVQGSSLSPMLGNIFLHHVLDLWFQRDVSPRMKGRARLIRYADDFIIAFEREDDARRVLSVLGKRFEKFGLRLHPEKTRLLPFPRPKPRQPGRKGPATFDFLGFTVYWRCSRWGTWAPSFKTRKARLQRAIRSVNTWCRSHRHEAVREQHAALCRRLNGHLNYYGVNWNQRSVALVIRHAERAWHKWLSRRSQKRMSWRRFKEVLRVFRLPRPTVRVQLWQIA
jgi:RNA-directed DNA polymerase